ncbi:hypothetical protein F444_07561, partial [Phytophthora nicotianae P1976]
QSQHKEDPFSTVALITEDFQLGEVSSLANISPGTHTVEGDFRTLRRAKDTYGGRRTDML